MSLLLALTGGAPTSLTATISWTQQSSTWGIVEASSLPSSISWTQADSTWLVSANAKDSLTAAWTQQGDTWAITEPDSAALVVSWTSGSATWAITGTASSGWSATVAWTQDNASWSVASASQSNLAASWTQDNNTWLLNSTAGTSAVNADIAWVQDDAVWSTYGNVANLESPNSGGYDYGENKRIHAGKEALLASAKKVIKKAKKRDDDAFGEAVDVIAEIRAEIDNLGIKAEYYERINKQQAMIQAQLAKEQLEAQIEEIDTVFAILIMLAQLD
jgi:hypothetical protein